MRFARPFFRQDAIWVESVNRFLILIGYRSLKTLSMETANPHLFTIRCGAGAHARENRQWNPPPNTCPPYISNPKENLPM